MADTAKMLTWWETLTPTGQARWRDVAQTNPVLSVAEVAEVEAAAASAGDHDTWHVWTNVTTWEGRADLTSVQHRLTDQFREFVQAH